MSYKTSPLVSVVVPVFNAEQYVERCLLSLQNQTLEHIEFIIVDDGSDDQSKEIIKKQINNDKRFKYIYQTNCGPSIARNRGITVAKGRYLGFVDADDWVEPEMFKILAKSAEENHADIVICNAITHNHKNQKKRLYFDTKIYCAHKGELPAFFNNFLQFKYDYANWNKLFNRQLIEQHEIQFDDNLRVGEDMLFNINCIVNSKYIYCLNIPYYHYFEQNNSIMSRYFHEAPVAFLQIYHKSLGQFNSDMKGVFKNTFGRIIYYSIVESLIKLKKDKQIQYWLINKLKERKLLLRQVLNKDITKQYGKVDRIRICLLKIGLFSFFVKTL